MKKRFSKKNSFLKKKFIQLCRLLGFEIIDQASYEVVTSEKKINEKLSELGERSITIPTGQLKIKRAVKNLHVIMRTCMLDSMLTQKKKRLFEKKKIEYVLRSLQSLLNAINYFKKNNKNFDIKISILDTRSKIEQVNKLKNFIKKTKMNIEIKTTNLDEFKNKISGVKSIAMFSFMSNLYNSFNMAKKSEYDLTYFIDDDYIHHPKCIEELIYTYEKFATLTNKEIILCPSDYPYLYFKPENTYILLGENYHWRRVNESLCVFMTSKKMIKKKWNDLIKLANCLNDPFEKPLHKIYKKEICFSPIPSISMHYANINSIYGLSPNVDWIAIWKKSEYR